MRAKQVLHRIRELYQDGQKIREKQAQKPLPIPAGPFVLTLLTGSTIEGLIGHFVYQNLLIGILAGFCMSFILFFVFTFEDKP